MSFDSQQLRMSSLGFGVSIGNFPVPDGEIDGQDRALIWGSYYSAFPPNPDYEGNHVGIALSLLIEQFKPRPLINGMVRVQAERMQGLEAASSPVYTGMGVRFAVGQQLDFVGEIVGQSRGGLQDDDYRTAIYARVGVNSSNGEPESVMTAVRFFTRATFVSLIERVERPAHIYLFATGPVLPSNLYHQVKSVMPGGVGLTLVWTSSGPWFQFGRDAGSAVPVPEGEGWGEHGYIDPGTGLPVGGHFAELIS